MILWIDGKPVKADSPMVLFGIWMTSPNVSVYRVALEECYRKGMPIYEMSLKQVRDLSKKYGF